jgi:hypothetical protein
MALVNEGNVFFYFPIYLQAIEIHSANGVMGNEGW